MPPVVAIAASVASAAAGVAGAVNQKKDAKRARNDQIKAQNQQKLEASNLAALSESRDETGAEIALGTSSAADELLTRKNTRKGSSAATGTKVGKSLASTKVGGL